MTSEAVPDGRTERRRARSGGPTEERREVARRRFVRLASVSIPLGLGGCLGRDPGRGTTTSTLEPRQVTITTGDGVEILVARVVTRDDAVGPIASYRLRNVGDADETVALRTVLHVAEGGTYEATTHVDVPAGGQVTVGYPVATWSELDDGETESVRRGDGDFDVYVNGERRSDA